MHTTNYTNTFIQVAEDCPVRMGEIPPVKTNVKTVANLHFEMIAEKPYHYSSDDVIFNAHAIKNDISKNELKA